MMHTRERNQVREGRVGRLEGRTIEGMGRVAGMEEGDKGGVGVIDGRLKGEEDVARKVCVCLCSWVGRWVGGWVGGCVCVCVCVWVCVGVHVCVCVCVRERG